MKAVELAVIIPTLNERGNIRPLLDRLKACLEGVVFEVVFVDDDSSDGTPELIREIALENDRVRLIRRYGRRGLASACTEGMASSPAAYFAVMDADLQHDEKLLPEMLKILRQREVDIVVGSRFVSGSDLGTFSPFRRMITAAGRKMSRLVLKAELQDPLSGFFMLRRELFEASARRLSNTGFKILLDLFASSPSPVRFVELPFRFGERIHGQSKLDEAVGLEFLRLIAEKLFDRYLPVRFIIFGLVGATGVATHLLTLFILYRGLGLGFIEAHVAATVVAMTGNFYLNNRITYRDRRLTGFGFIRGLLSFYLACGIGALVNFSVARLLFDHQVFWLLAGFLGAVVGSVWNYVVTHTFTWHAPDRRTT